MKFSQKTGKTAAFISIGAISAAFLAFIGISRVVDLSFEQTAHFDHAPITLCAAEEVSRPDLDEALVHIRGLGCDIDVTCEGDPDIRMSVDMALETDDGGLGPELGSADDLGTESHAIKQTWGLTATFPQGSEVIDHSVVRLHPRAKAKTFGHELMHALGIPDPKVLPPTGSIMNMHRPGWDTRGVEGVCKVKR